YFTAAFAANCAAGECESAIISSARVHELNRSRIAATRRWAIGKKATVARSGGAREDNETSLGATGYPAFTGEVGISCSCRIEEQRYAPTSSAGESVEDAIGSR